MQYFGTYSRRDILRYKEIQEELRKRVALNALTAEPRLIAGVDVSMNLSRPELFAGVVVINYPKLDLVEESVVIEETDFPYIPGLLSFRELPALISAIKKLSNKPDVFIVDGQGIAHPRGLGIASHLGVEIEVPTIGCAKSVLWGMYKEPEALGEANQVQNPKTGERIGTALKSKLGSNPLIISPGHMVSHEDALRLVKDTLRGFRLPEPTRRAHILVNNLRKSYKK